MAAPARYQRDLFPLEGAPDGLLFEPEIMTAAEEIAFLEIIKALPFGAFRMHGVDAKRRVVRFGVHYVAGSAAMTPASDFPAPLEPLRSAGLCSGRYSEPRLVRILDNGVRRGGRHRLASRFAPVRDRGRHLLRWRLPDALPTRGGKGEANVGNRASAAIPLLDDWRRAGRMAAQHSAGQGPSLVDHVSYVTKLGVLTKTSAASSFSFFQEYDDLMGTAASDAGK